MYDYIIYVFFFFVTEVINDDCFCFYNIRNSIQYYKLLVLSSLSVNRY